MCIYIIGLMFYISVLTLNKNKYSGASFFNPFGYIELHIDSKAKYSKRKFLKISIDTILIAYEKKQKVLFTTNLIKEKNIQLFDNVGVKLKVLFPEKMVMTIFKICFICRAWISGHKINSFDYIKYLIDTSKINNDLLEKLREKQLKLNERLKSEKME